MPRIIAGKAKGVRLVAPKGSTCRPSSDRMKEALFSIIGDRILGASFLDVFAGTGQLGLEALSRGALSAVMIEKDPRALQALWANIRKTRLEEGARVLPGDCRSRLKSLVRQGETFDFLYLDPPWQEAPKLLGQVMDSLVALVDKGGWMILESEGEGPPSDLKDPRLSLFRSCQYGRGVLSFYQLKDSGQEA